MRSPLEPKVQPQATNAGSSEAVDRRFSDANATGRMNTAVQKNINKPAPGSNITSVSELGSQATTPTPGEKGSAGRDPFLEGLNEAEQKELQSKYNFAYSLIVTNPDLRRIFIEAVTSGMEVEAFDAAIRGSSWYSAYDNNKREYLVAKTKGGADWTRIQKTASDSIKNSAVKSLGRELTQEELNIATDEFLMSFGTTKIDPTILSNFVGKRFAPNGALTYGGSAATNGVALNTYAKSMGFKISGSELSNYVSKIAAGEDTIDNIQSNVLKNAINLYPQYADRFNSGATFDDVMYPYIKTMEQLGFDVSNLDTQKDGTADIFVDDLLQKAAFAVDAKGNPAPMSVYNFRSAALKDKRWQYTDNAYEKYASVAKDVISSFGGSV